MRFRWGIIGAGSIAGKMVDALRRTVEDQTPEAEALPLPKMRFR